MKLPIQIIFYTLRYPRDSQPWIMDGPLEVNLGQITVTCRDRVQVLLLPSNLPYFPQSFTSFSPLRVNKKA